MQAKRPKGRAVGGRAHHQLVIALALVRHHVVKELLAVSHREVAEMTLSTGIVLEMLVGSLPVGFVGGFVHAHPEVVKKAFLPLGGASTCFLGFLSGCFPVRFQVEVSPAALCFLDTDTMSLGKASYLRLAQTVLLHDVKAGVVCLRLCLALLTFGLPPSRSAKLERVPLCPRSCVGSSSYLAIAFSTSFFLKAVVPQAWTDAN